MSDGDAAGGRHLLRLHRSDHPGFHGRDSRGVCGYLRQEHVHGAARRVPILRCKQALADFRSPGAVLFALLLFFQFGNEWSIAGWLPLFLIRRVGLSPKAALLILALYWLFLMIGRMGAVAILPRVRHGRLLLGSVLAALFGCLHALFHEQHLRRGHGGILCGGGVRQHLSAGGGSDRAAISLLSSRILQRHLLGRAGGRAGGAGHSGLCGGGAGSGRGHRHSAVRAPSW